MKNQLPIETVITRLGYENSDNLIRYNDFKTPRFSVHTKKILSEIKPYATYILDTKLFIFFFDTSFDTRSFKKICKQVWNSQVPIAFFCDENTVKVYNGTSIDITSYELKKITEMNIGTCTPSSNFSYLEISDPYFWTQYSSNYSSPKLNESLLDNITFLTKLLKENHISFATKLLLRLIFIRYLIDRGVDLAYGSFTSDIENSKSEFLKVMRDKKSLYELFKHLQDKFNGNLFNLGDEYNSSELTSDVLNLLADFLSGEKLLEDGQWLLFALYDFNIIPVELISNIYEILLGKEIQKKDKAFYTPNYLVEYILDKTITPFLEQNDTCKILDPACGSGVFLVDSYRRIIEKNLQGKLYCEDDTILKTLLTENIYGIDVNEDAIDVTIFSLYLTVLDYKNPKTLLQFKLPYLKGTNLVVNDFFDEEKLVVLKKIDFDFIIGNPPWGGVVEGLHMDYCKKYAYLDKQQNKEISRSFVFRAKDFSSKNTVCCFILPSKLLYNKEEPAKKFRQFLLTETEINNIVEMSSVRKLIFKKANAPAVIITFKYYDEEKLDNVITYISLKPNIFFKLFNILVIEKNDVKYIEQNMLHTNDWAWKTIVYGFFGDFNNINYLNKFFLSLKDILSKQIPSMITGEGIQSFGKDKKDATHLLGKPILNPLKGINHFSINLDNLTIFNIPKIHRPRNSELFHPPYCINTRGVDCSNFKMKAVFIDETFICKHSMYVIKGDSSQHSFLLNLTGLLNSSLYAYLNLMMGSSIGIEREQRSMTEVLSFPYQYSNEVADKVLNIQSKLKKNDFFNPIDVDKEVEELDTMILALFGLENNNFIDYALNIQIPELTKSKTINSYRKVSYDDLLKYSECFEKQFSLIYEKVKKYIGITIYPDVLNKFSIFELTIHNEKPEQKIKSSNIADDNKELLSRFCVFKQNDMFFQIKDVIHFEENSFFIIKPNYYKNWHPAIAEIDLADVIDQIMSDNEVEQNE